ncbi:hypothetical protein EVG20_g3206 [Dentipellis fragilis]|uniref:WW domain-containing protein n=1 Tax=Dentipellis fragilis TaxID=205917 RepID=A0A4Y9Z5D2_9AGAM|nr:hypothetical protein EVG20_g3206 [Dentipellis fragilis]
MGQLGLHSLSVHSTIIRSSYVFSVSNTETERHNIGERPEVNKNVDASKALANIKTSGNKYYEYPSSTDDPRRTKRRVKYKDYEDVWAYVSGSRRIPVQWTSWLTHTRHHPPTLEELRVDIARQRRVLANAAVIDARVKKSALLSLLAMQRLHLMIRAINSRFTHDFKQAWVLLWILIRRRLQLSKLWFQGRRQPQDTSRGFPNALSTVGSSEKEVVISASFVPPNASQPNIQLRPMAPGPIARPASAALPSDGPRPYSFVSETGSTSYLDYRRTRTNHSADNLSIASHRLSVLQADARLLQMARRNAERAKPRPRRPSTASRDFVVTSRPRPPLSTSRRSSPARPGSPRPSRPASPARPGSLLRPDSVVLPGSGSRTPYSDMSKSNSVVEVNVDPPSEASSTMEPAAEVQRPELLPGRCIKQMVVEDVSRYASDYIVPGQDNISTVPAMTIHFPHTEEGSCGEWTPVSHPEGALYFYHRQKRVFTDNYMYDETTREELECFIDYLDDLVLALHGSWPSACCDRVMEITPDEDGEMNWRYYCIEHETRSMFWIEDYDCEFLTYELKGVTSMAHIKLTIESNYWEHWTLYPEGPQEIPMGLRDELLAICIHSAIDDMTSPSSTVSYDAKQFLQMATLIKRSQAVSGPGNITVIAGLARLMSFFYYWRYTNFHGQRGARLIREKSIHGSKPQRTFLITALSPLLFWAPEAHLRDLEQIYVDFILHEKTWSKFIKKLQNEWNEFVVFSTILLNANVAFLAIPSVMILQDNDTLLNSPAQIASYLSIATSIGSIVLGLLLIRQNRAASRTDTNAASEDLYHRTATGSGLEPLAIIYSLPYALLMWAMVTFLLAILLLSFRNTDLATRIPMAIVSIAMASLILWCIVSGTERRESKPWLEGVKKFFSENMELTKEVVDPLREQWKHEFLKLRTRLGANVLPNSNASYVGSARGSV